MEYGFNLETGPTSNDGNEDTHFYSPSQWKTSGCKWGNYLYYNNCCLMQWWQEITILCLIPSRDSHPKNTALLDSWVSSFHLGRSEVSRPPEQIIQTLLPISQIHTETDTAWGMQLEHHTCHRNPLNSSIQIQAQIVSASYFLRSCTQYPGLQKCHLSVKHEVGLIFLRAGWCNCTNIRQHYYLFISK